LPIRLINVIFFMNKKMTVKKTNTTKKPIEVFSLSWRVALITGAARGLGFGYATPMSNA